MGTASKNNYNERCTVRGARNGDPHVITQALEVLETPKAHTRHERREAQRQIRCSARHIKKWILPEDRGPTHKVCLRVGEFLKLAV